MALRIRPSARRMATWSRWKTRLDALADQVPLELGHGDDDRKHDPAVGQSRQSCPSDDDALLCAKGISPNAVLSHRHVFSGSV
jgi:hypothetical protein